MTSDVDPHTACFVRFYHEKFQKDKPQLLHQIKRATKTDQQSKDEVESLKHDVAKLKETLSLTAAQYDQKLAELSYECNRRITAMNAEYDKLAALVHSAITPRDSILAASSATASSSASQVPDLLHSLSQAAVSLQNHLRAPSASHTEGPTNTTTLIMPPVTSNREGSLKRPATNESAFGGPSPSRAKKS